jgi:hypothetical protein
MHPWITGRIVETMQHEARTRAAHSRTGRAPESEPRRERLGLAVARLGYRIAGCVPRRDAEGLTGWTTCPATSSATSTSSR